MGLVEICALWPPKQGGSSLFTGKMQLPQGGQDPAGKQAAFRDILRRAAQGEDIRIVVLRNDQQGNPKAPVARVMADDGQEDQPQQAHGQQPPPQQQGYQGYGTPPQQQDNWGGMPAGQPPNRPAPPPPQQAPTGPVDW